MADAREDKCKKISAQLSKYNSILPTRADAITTLMLNSCKTHKKVVYPFTHYAVINYMLCIKADHTLNS